MSRLAPMASSESESESDPQLAMTQWKNTTDSKYARAGLKCIARMAPSAGPLTEFRRPSEIRDSGRYGPRSEDSLRSIFNTSPVLVNQIAAESPFRGHGRSGIMLWPEEDAVGADCAAVAHSSGW